MSWRSASLKIEGNVKEKYVETEIKARCRLMDLFGASHFLSIQALCVSARLHVRDAVASCAHPSLHLLVDMFCFAAANQLLQMGDFVARYARL